MKLKTEISLFSVILVTIMVVGLTAVLLIYEKHEIKNQIEENQLNIARNLQKICEESVITKDEFLLLNYMDTVKKVYGGIEYVFFMDNKRRVLPVKESRVFRERYDEISAVDEFLTKKSNTVEVIFPVTVSGEREGTGVIGYSKGYMLAQIDSKLKRITGRIIGVAAVVLLAGVIISLLIANSIVSPLRKLEGGAKEIAKGNLDYRIDVAKKNEIGMLAEEFNTMTVKLKEIDRIKSDFVSSVSHELRSPLSIINSYIDLFLEESGDRIKKNEAEYFEIIKRNIFRLSTFISDILDAAKLEAGMMQIRKEQRDIYPVVFDVIEFIAPKAEEKKIKISADIPESLPEVIIDEDKIKQVLINLIDNAVKFTPEDGKIEVVCSREDGENMVEVAVKDNGAGIPEEELPFIFDKFRQVEKSLYERKVKGTGLGLSIVKMIVEQHGGKVRAESKAGNGSVFTFSLPAA